MNKMDKERINNLATSIKFSANDIIKEIKKNENKLTLDIVQERIEDIREDLEKLEMEVDKA